MAGLGLRELAQSALDLLARAAEPGALRENSAEQGAPEALQESAVGSVRTESAAMVARVVLEAAALPERFPESPLTARSSDSDWLAMRNSLSARGRLRREQSMESG